MRNVLQKKDGKREIEVVLVSRCGVGLDGIAARGPCTPPANYATRRQDPRTTRQELTPRQRLDAFPHLDALTHCVICPTPCFERPVPISQTSYALPDGRHLTSSPHDYCQIDQHRDELA